MFLKVYSFYNCKVNTFSLFLQHFIAFSAKKVSNSLLLQEKSVPLHNYKKHHPLHLKYKKLM